MKFSFTGYRWWKQAKKELELSTIYILPNLEIHQDRTYELNEYPTQIKFAWLFWEVSIYLCI